MTIRFPKHERGPYRGRYIDPEGQLVGCFEELMRAGCIQAELPHMVPRFHVLMVATGKNPCNGCPVWSEKGPACKAFQKYHTAYSDAIEKHKRDFKDATTPENVGSNHPLAGLSVRRIAENLGVSLSEVRRRKANGTL